MYYPQQPKEPAGCVQAFVITRVIFAMLAVPMLMIVGAMATVGLTFYIYTVNPLLALIPLGLGVFGVVLLARWEQARIARDNPEED